MGAESLERGYRPVGLTDVRQSASLGGSHTGPCVVHLGDGAAERLVLGAPSILENRDLPVPPTGEWRPSRRRERRKVQVISRRLVLS